MAIKKGSNHKSDIDTKKSKIFRETFHLRELSARMMDVSQQLKLQHDVMTNCDSSLAVHSAHLKSSTRVSYQSLVSLQIVLRDQLLN